MKGLVLAGGRGTRLRPLTHTTNKHLLPIGNEPMIYRVIKDLIDADIHDIIINVNKGDKTIEDAIKLEKWNAKFTFIEQPTANGMMYPILLAEKLIKDENVILHAGDNILSGGLKKYIDKFNSKNYDALILVTKVENPERFSVYQVEDDKATHVVEKPKEFIGELAGTAIYIYKANDIIKAMKHIKPIDPENKGKPEYFPPPAHQWLIDNHYDVRVVEVTGWWKDTGKPNDLLLANRMVLEKRGNYNIFVKPQNSQLEGNIEVQEGSNITNSIIRGPVVIGKNVRIENSYIGPFTSVGSNVTIVNTQIENSIIMESATLENNSNRLDGCLIGSNALVRDKNQLPKSTSLFVGDDSVIEF